MNIVLLADKKTRKAIETEVKKNPNITLLGTEMIIRANTINRIAEHHNPHILVIYPNVPEKDGITLDDVISLLKMKKPNLRYVYVYGKITDLDTFREKAENLMANGINDIVTDETQLVNVIENPMTADDVHNLIDKLQEEQAVEETAIEVEEETAQEYEELKLDFPVVSSLTEFDIDKVITISNNTEEKKSITIGITALQHHLGCTHTAFEIATVLSKKNTVALIIADNDTFERYMNFHKIGTCYAQEGLKVQGIDVYPYEKLKDVQEEYSAVICDFGYSTDEYKEIEYSNCQVKIMLCSSAEWDMPQLTNYMKYPKEDYVHNVHYCFGRTTQSRFLKFNKALLRSGFKAHRLHNSPEWFNPRKENEEIYRNILGNYIELPTVPKVKRKLIKVK